MLFTEQLITNQFGRDQFASVGFARNAAEAGANPVMREMFANTGIIPRDVYQDFDNVTIERFRSDDGDTFINDLLPLSRSVNIGKLTSQYRRASDAGNVQTSMTGQIGALMDQTEFSYDGTIVPIHDAGFFRNWREWEAQRSEGFDALIDDTRETVASIRSAWADTILEGAKDKKGAFIDVDGFTWQGMKNDSRVEQIDLGAGGLNFDFTSTANTGDQIKAAFITIRDTLWITNNCGKDITVYVSREIASNFERKFSTQYDAKIIMQELADLMGIAAIKPSSKLVGNELMGFPLDSSAIRPVVGMGINTVAMPRPVYNSNYEFVTWHAAGFQVVNDFSGQTCTFFAQA